MIQFSIVPIISALHMLINFQSAWRPALAFIIGAAMIASAIATMPSLVLAQ